MSIQKLHKSFHLNEKRFSDESDLINYSKNYSKVLFDFLSKWFDHKDFITVSTSGSTGKPKEIQLRKQYMKNSAKATGAYFELTENTVALLCLPLDYIAGKMMLVRGMTLGWSMDMVEPDTNPLKRNKKQYDFSAMVPLQAYNSIGSLSKIKKLIIGGGIVSKELENKLKNISTECFVTYGMTETITHIAVRQLNTSSSKNYLTLPDVKVTKDDRDCLVINAPNISKELVVTNDIVELISGDEFKWLGRYDTIINSGGVKVIPEQIEEKLSTIIDNRFFVSGISDSILGEKLILVIESKENDNVISYKVRNLNSLSKYEIPKEIYFLPKFMETGTKKIQRQKTLDLIF